MLRLVRPQHKGKLTLLKFDMTRRAPPRRRLVKLQETSLYVSRPLLNAEDIYAWMKSAGFKTAVQADEMHTTICYSKEPVRWESTIASDFTLSVPQALPGERSIAQFGSAVVLRFYSKELEERWRHFRDLGASWSHDNYNPHLTLTWDSGGLGDVSAIPPYEGELLFGPEIFQQVKDGWKDRIDEVRIKSEIALKSNPNRDEHGRFASSDNRSEDEKHNDAHLASLSPEVQTWHKSMGAIAAKHGYKEIGTAIVPGDDMYSHKMYRNSAGDRLHFYPKHEDNKFVWGHFEASGKQRSGTGSSPKDVDDYLKGK